jgi:nucleotide-binding universal stress UspA family protein
MLKVIIAVDGSAALEPTLAFARNLLAGKPTSVTLLHVIAQHMVYSKGGAATEEVYDMPREREACTQLLKTSAQQLQSAGVGPTITEHLVTGDPADQILTAAENLDADLIILGSRGLNAVQRFLLGSVSTKVTTHAPCAALVVRPKAALAKIEVSNAVAAYPAMA